MQPAPTDLPNNKFIVFKDGSYFFWDYTEDGALPPTDEELEAYQEDPDDYDLYQHPMRSSDFQPTHADMIERSGKPIEEALFWGVVEDYISILIMSEEAPTDQDIAVAKGIFGDEYINWFGGGEDHEIFLGNVKEAAGDWQPYTFAPRGPISTFEHGGDAVGSDQYNYYLIGRNEESIGLGYIEWSAYMEDRDNPQISVQMVETAEEYKRQGVATALYETMIEYMKNDFPLWDGNVNTGMHTEDGSQFLNSVQASILSPVQEDRDIAIWDGDHLRPEVSEFCFAFVEDYLKNFMVEEEIPVHLQRIILIGSITGYQYDDDADIDVNILVDIDTLADNLGLEKELLIYEMRGTVGKVNGEIYPGTSHPVNIFLSTDEGYPPADGIYDMMTDEWIKKPGHPGDIDPYSSLKDAIDKAEEIAEKIDAKWGAAQRTKAEIDRYPQSAPQIIRQYLRYLKSLKRILDNVVSDRREAMDLAKKLELPPPQTGIPNVVYKYLEYNGLLDHLHEAAKTLKRWEETGSFTEIPSEAPVSLTEGLPVTIEGPVQMSLVEAVRKQSDAPEPFIFVVSPQNELKIGSRDGDGSHEALIAAVVLEQTGETISNWHMDAYEGNPEAEQFVKSLDLFARGEFSYSYAPDGTPEPTGFFFAAFPEQAQKAVEVLQGLPPETQFDWEVNEEFDSGPIGEFLGSINV